MAGMGSKMAIGVDQAAPGTDATVVYRLRLEVRPLAGPSVDVDVSFKARQVRKTREVVALAIEALTKALSEAAPGCPLDTDGDGNCHVHPKGCPAPAAAAEADEQRPR
jgi:hypothetical protein